MAGLFLNICGPVVSDTAYVNNELVAKDVEATLPEVTPTTADVQAMGTMSIPIWQYLENLELSITKIGVDKGLRSMMKPEPLNLELRFVQTVTDANGNTKNVGCKAFMKGIPNKLPEIAVTPGEATENECTMMLTRYQLFANGEEMFLIDRLAGICRIAGKDYAADLSSML